MRKYSHDERGYARAKSFQGASVFGLNDDNLINRI